MTVALSLFEQPFFANIILPFLLIFTIVFAILQKTKIFGDNKQADIIISLVIGLIFVGVPAAVGVTLKLLPIISVMLVIILSLLLLFAFSSIGTIKEKGFELPIGIKWLLGIILFVALIISILWATNSLESVSLWLKTTKLSPDVWQTLIFFGIMAAAIAVVAAGKKKS